MEGREWPARVSNVIKFQMRDVDGGGRPTRVQFFISFFLLDSGCEFWRKWLALIRYVTRSLAFLLVGEFGNDWERRK